MTDGPTMTMPRGVDVVVVGSGIVGAASAAALAARGASVVLLDKENAPAREGSGRAQGSLRVQGRHHAEFPLAREALELWAEAAAEGDFEFVVGGNLYIRTTAEELPVLQRLVDEAHRAGLTDVELLDADQTRTVIPCATGPFLGAMWSPVDAACQPATATAHYVERAERAGVHLGYGVKVTELLEARGHIAGVHTTAGPIAADAVVVAAGVWTPYLANTVGVVTALSRCARCKTPYANPGDYVVHLQGQPTCASPDDQAAIRLSSPRPPGSRASPSTICATPTNRRSESRKMGFPDPRNTGPISVVGHDGSRADDPAIAWSYRGY